MEKRSYLGMAGHYAAMAEFLYRGYNVAVPSVDVGDDVYVVEDRDGAMRRLQVKTSDTPAKEERDDHRALVATVGQYTLSQRQLRTVKQNELFFMFMIRWERRWRFVLIARDELLALRENFETSDRAGRRGRKPTASAAAKTDKLTLKIEWRLDDAIGWGTSLRDYLDNWPAKFPLNAGGPGAVNAAAVVT